MKKIIVIILVVAIGWYGYYLYKQDGSTFASKRYRSRIVYEVKGTGVELSTNEDGMVEKEIDSGTFCSFHD